MEFQTAKRMVLSLFVMIVLCCVSALILRGSNESLAAVITYFAVALLAFVTFIIFKWLRCHWCGGVLLRRVVWLKSCPHCNRDLVTGLRDKKKAKAGK